jgi:hypothetical protein
MRKLGQLFVDFLYGERGPTALECALILGILACILAIASIFGFGTSASNVAGATPGPP